MKKHLHTRLLSMILVVALLFGLSAPAAAAGNHSKVTFTQVDNSTVTADLLTTVADDIHDMQEYVDTDVVRVSIFLEDQSTIMAGYSTENIAQNDQAMAYRANLEDKQAAVTEAIERKIGAELDVVWNLTLAANIISANVEYGQIETIEQVSGVSQVLIETMYQPDVVSGDEADDPNMSTSAAQIGSAAAWAAGYTGAGSRIAVIDTGADTDHQSLDPQAYQYSLAYQAGLSGLSLEEYLEKIDLLDAEEIAAVSSELNAPVGAEAYINSKIPFGYNYIDGDLDVTHDNDSQGSHGSHVSGIATANAYIRNEDSTFANAMQTALVQGVAPDAQLIAMKVFGKNGGAYDSDYMAAIEDAIVLGCDAANLSLGSGNPGTSRNATAAYQAILDSLTECGMVVAMSAGNSGYWVENAYNVGYLYSDDVSMQTNGSPGSFTNSLSVASVDNDGTTGYYVMVGENMIVYNETDYSNEPFTTIAGEQEYVFIDGVGTAADWATVGEALTGKIALCSRGTTSFFEKAQLAVEAGAIATFIYNNTSGVINMDLTDYPYTQPVASITQAQGAAIKAASTAVTDDAGNVLYYTGKMTVSSSLGVGQFNSEYYTMSSFSSWGVPGSLELKPEITAPGGSIYSINGVDPSGSAYEVMSGTSMASPQVAGMAAVVAQYIRDNDLVAKTGMSERHLAQSLLMSTAEPMLASAGSYYSVMQQGAGLANVGAATTADSYITMAEGSSAGAADGKVKVELGDDPERAGTYTATFTINNMTDVEKAFELSADFFIQAPFLYYANGNYSMSELSYYMDTATTLIGADVAWSVDGVDVTPADMGGMDFNGDGVVNSDDGQAILDYATGVSESMTNLDKADLDADGDVDSYDAYLFLSTLTTGTATVPAGGSATVTVTVSLSDSWKATLDNYYPNGTYIQGYIFAESLTDAEGVAGTSHSIPVLGFYGCWSDASMYDVGTYQTYATGEEYRLPYLGKPSANTYLIHYASDDDPDTRYVFGGNPLVTDDTYMPERNAINSGDMIAGVQFTLIRNAAASKFTAVNETTGETLVEAFPGAVSSAYYHSNYGIWRSTGYTLGTEITPSSASEGDILTLALTMAPEYYQDAEGNVAWDALGDGATFAISAVVDNTAPELKDVSMSLTGNTMTVTASDNEYIAAVALYNKSGTKVLAYDGAKQEIEKGETASYSFSLDGVNGKKFLLQVMDYAMNTTTYLIEMQIGEEQPLPEMIVFDLDYNHWTTFTKDTVYDWTTGMEVYENSDLTFFAGTIVDHMVLASTDTGDLYVMPEDDLTDMTFIANTGTILTDMAYNAADGNVYAVDQYGNLVTVDKLTGAVTIVGEIGVLTNTLACDANGTFYCNGYGTGAVYSFTLDTIDAPAVLVEDVGITSQYVQAMEINPNTGMLCWNSYYLWYGIFGMSYYIEVDPTTGEWNMYNDLWDEFACLLIPEKAAGGSWTEPTDEVGGMTISADTLSLLKGGNAKLSANVLPWTATDRTVTWTTSDANVATVDAKGIVTAVSEGTATITATSNLDSSFSVSCVVTVETLDVTVNGTLQDADGNPMFYSWNMATDDTWTAGAALDTSMTSATYSTKEKAYYIMDAVSDVWAMHKVGEDGVTIQTAANSAGVPLWDMAYSEYFTEVNGVENVSSIYYYYFLSPKNPMALDAMAFNLSSRVSYLTGITSLGYEQYPDGETGELLDTEHIILMDNLGKIWNFWIYNKDGGMSAWLNSYPSDLPLEFPGDDTMENMYTSLVVGEDGALYVSSFNGDTNELYRLVFDEAAEKYVSAKIGDVGQDVWPATITSVTVNAETEAPAFTAPAATEQMDAVAVSAEELKSASLNARVSDTYAMSEDARAEKVEMLAVKPSVDINSDATVGEGEDTITVNVTAKDAAGNDVAATNGVATVTWNADMMTLTNVVVNGDYTAKVESDGSVTFGYVSTNGFAAGETVATLTFQVEEANGSAITIEHKQVNNVVGGTETVPVEFEHANTEVRDAVAATCTTAGYTGDTYCTDCGQLIAHGEIIEATGHSYGEWTVTTEPTCTEEGVETRTCAVCGETETQPVAATGHTFGDWTVTTAPTCTEEGVETRTCACGETETRAVAATGHSYESVVVEPTCTEQGYTVHTCAVCGDSYIDSYTDAHCASAGYTDVALEAWYHEAVDYVVENGLMNGMTDTIFNPDGAMNRAQMVTVLYRMAGSPAVEEAAPFTDVNAGSYYADAVAWAVANGITKGVSSDKFAPDAVVTRETMVTFLYRYAALSGADMTVTGDLSAYEDASSVSGWAVEAMTWAVENGIISGVTATTLEPAATTNRAQVATVLMRYCEN